PAPQAGSMAPPPVGGDAAASMGLTADQEDFWGAPASPPPRQTAPNAPLAAPRPKPAPVNTPRQDVAHTMDLNTAAESDLASLPGIGPVLAKRIVAERSSRGGFSNVEQLAEIGVPPHVVVRLRPLVAFSQLPGARRPRGRIVDV
ncbi:MAG: helix-hairpin-helix domain-containing protein, partial [Chloroflexi bacterium]|nr:helix-hairpin-helix domain-containing protein [Chloroflexota bacterium]